MTQPPEKNRYRPTRRNAEEDRAWFHLYRDAGEYAVAQEVVKHLDSDTEAKQAHLALYLRCRRTLRLQKARQERNERIGSFVRQMVAIIVIAPIRALSALLRGVGDLAVETLPEIRREPAVSQLRRLRQAPEFANVDKEFSQATVGQAGGPAEPSTGESRSVKAA